MPTDVTKTLRKALADLQADRKQIDQQIAAIEKVLGTDTGGPRRRAGRPARARNRTRNPMSAAARS